MGGMPVLPYNTSAMAGDHCDTVLVFVVNFPCSRLLFIPHARVTFKITMIVIIFWCMVGIVINIPGENTTDWKIPCVIAINRCTGYWWCLPRAPIYPPGCCWTFCRWVTLALLQHRADAPFPGSMAGPQYGGVGGLPCFPHRNYPCLNRTYLFIVLGGLGMRWPNHLPFAIATVAAAAYCYRRCAAVAFIRSYNHNHL